MQLEAKRAEAGKAPPPLDPVPGPARRVHQSEVLSALSRALDMTEGQPVGHTLRSCAIGMRLGEAVGLGEAERSALYYALLLKDAGCSSNAARMAALFGSGDQEVKYGMKLVDRHRTVPLALRTARLVGLGRSLATRARHFLGLARQPAVTQELIRIRCDRGAEIVRQLGFPAGAAEAVRCLDEHWCGLGHPAGLRGEEIPILARIANLAQTVEVYLTARGLASALRVARERSGTWFDPRLVEELLSWRHDRRWWRGLLSPELEGWVIEAEPGAVPRGVDDDGLDDIARSFADIIDAKSPYTFNHSRNVAEYARAIGAQMGMGADDRRRLYRAGLLHDIGKLGVSSRILDKEGPLTPDERAEIERHPLFSWQVLSRVDAFRDFARTAVVHHEKLDGSGYPWKLVAAELGPADRVLCVADVYDALTADRPYRAGMPPPKALGILRSEAGSKLCPDAVDALAALVEDALA